MKISWLIQNRKKRRESPRVSLFPFLAVLICTMGALVLLLLTVTREARLQAAKAAAAHDGERIQALQADLDLVAWRIEQLKKSRGETEKQLTDARLVLGHLEDHDRRLRQQLTDLTAKDHGALASDSAEIAARKNDADNAKILGDLESQVVQAESNLASAARQAGQRPRGYSIVPYNGPNQTRRRPIYIECNSGGVVIQPGGIAFLESDFDGPLGPGNPLAAAVRAAREYMLLQSRSNPGAGEPYPLLLVRPDGIPAYDAAMEAMKSWGSEFGYEFVNDDWKLAFPPQDPGLANTMRDAVAIARAEHDRLIAAAPSKYGKRARPGAYRGGDGAGSDGVGGNGSGGNGVGGGDSNSAGFYASHPTGRYGGQPGDYGGSGGASGPSGSGNSTANGTGNGSNGTTGNTFGHGVSLADHNPYAAIGTPGGNGGGGAPGGVPGGYGGGGTAGGASQVAYSGAGSYPGGYGKGTGGSYPGGYQTGYPGASSGGASGGYPGGAGGGYPGGTAASGGAGGNSGMGSGSGSGGGSSAGGSAGSGGTSPSFVFGSNGQGQGGLGQNNLASADGGSATPSNTSSSGATGQPGTSSQSGGMAQAGSTGAGQSSGSGQTGNQGGGGYNGPPPPTPEGYLAGRPSDGQQPPPSSNNVAGGQPLGPLRPGEYRAPDDTPPKKLTPEEEEKLKKDKDRLAYKQESDWGLRSHSPRAAAISRPVRVECYGDRMIVVPSQGEGQPKVIAFGARAESSVDAMIVSVWELIDAWGMAGKNMYWRPVLEFYVMPGGEPRFKAIVGLLEGSGLKVERKQ